MTKIPRNRQSDQNISKPLKWQQYHWNIQNEKNKLETYQITKIPLKPPKQPKYPKMTKILSEPSKWPKCPWNHQITSGGKVSTYLVILGAKCHFLKIGYRECNFIIPQGCQCIPFFLLFSFIHKSNTKKNFNILFTLAQS